MFLGSSCIVADPPEYRDPLQTRPVLDAVHASPSNLQIIVVDTKSVTPISFNIPVRSEDAGHDLGVRFDLDFGVPSVQRQLVAQTIAASTSNNDSRAVQFAWSAKADAGCHLLTLVVAHIDSFLPNNNELLDPKKADTDAAILNWWINVDPAPGLQHTLSNCPTAEFPQ